MTIRKAKYISFSALFMSSDSHPEHLFLVCWFLLGKQELGNFLQVTVRNILSIPQHTYKALWFHSELEYGCTVPLEVIETHLSPVIWENPEPIDSADMDRVLVPVSLATGVLDPCPSWLRHGSGMWLGLISG